MPFRFVNLPRVAVLAVVRWCRWWSAGAGAVHFRRILQEMHPPPGCFPLHIVLICKGMYRILQVPFHFPHFCAWIWLNSPSLAVSARFCCRLLDGRGMGAGDRRRCRSPFGRRLARNIGRRATLLPSSRRRSFLPFSAPRWWSPSFSVVLLLWLSCWGLWRSFLFRWGGYIRGYILSLFNRARN